MNARQLALDLLNRWPRSPGFADELLEDALRTCSLNESDRGFATELFYGCLRRQLALKFVLVRLVDKAPRPVIANLLKPGLYQLLFLRTPAHAAVNETVALAREKFNTEFGVQVYRVERSYDMPPRKDRGPHLRDKQRTFR